jgi:hypothetical protein
MIGQTISHYKILDTLGEGGMGEVYKVQQPLAQRRRAMAIWVGFVHFQCFYFF